MGASCHKCRTSPRLRKRYTNGRGTDYVTVNAVHSLWPRSNTSVYSLFTFGAVSTPILASRSNFSLSRKFLHVSFLSLSFFIPLSLSLSFRNESSTEVTSTSLCQKYRLTLALPITYTYIYLIHHAFSRCL